MIEVRNAHKALGEFSLRGVDLRVETGEYFVVLGPTGAGKTVLLECIAGLHRLDQGEVWLDGRNVTGLAPELRNVAYVPQDYVLFPHLTLYRNIAFSLELRKTPKEEIDARVQELAELLNISHLLSRRPRTLSGGEQQRGALARALAPCPSVLLLDEPLSALDEGTRAELSVHLARISEELRTTVIHVCHNFEEALELADRIAIVHQGRVLQVGTPSQVFRKPASEFIARFVGAQNLLRVEGWSPTDRRVTLQGGLVLTAADAPEGTPTVATIRPEDIALARPDRHNPSGVLPPQSNCIHCVLQTVEDRGRIYRLHLSRPHGLRVAMTRQAFESLGISPGDPVIAYFSPDALHLMAQ